MASLHRNVIAAGLVFRKLLYCPNSKYRKSKMKIIAILCGIILFLPSALALIPDSVGNLFIKGNIYQFSFK